MAGCEDDTYVYQQKEDMSTTGDGNISCLVEQEDSVASLT